jgi:hypothetical protein
MALVNLYISIGCTFKMYIAKNVHRLVRALAGPSKAAELVYLAFNAGKNTGETPEHPSCGATRRPNAESSSLGTRPD